MLKQQMYTIQARKIKSDLSTKIKRQSRFHKLNRLGLRQWPNSTTFVLGHDSARKKAHQYLGQTTPASQTKEQLCTYINCHSLWMSKTARTISKRHAKGLFLPPRAKNAAFHTVLLRKHERPSPSSRVLLVFGLARLHFSRSFVEQNPKEHHPKIKLNVYHLLHDRVASGTTDLTRGTPRARPSRPLTREQPESLACVAVDTWRRMTRDFRVRRLLEKTVKKGNFVSSGARKMFWNVRGYVLDVHVRWK